MEHTFLIGALISVCAKEITLRLNQIGGQPCAAMRKLKAQSESRRFLPGAITHYL